MELIQMKYFLAVAREESISKAADFLYITQPSLTRQIQKMEKEVGQPLFVRGKKMRLTEAGQLLRRRAEEILSLYEKTERELICPQASLGGDVYIGGGETRAMQFLLNAAQKMRAQYPNIKLHIHSGDIADVCEHIDKGLLDFGLVIEPADLSRYESLRLPYHEVWGLLMPKDRPLAAKKSISPQDLRGVPLIQSRHSLLRSNVTEWYRSVAEELNVVATYNLIYNAAQMVEAGLGYAIGLDKTINTTAHSGLCFRPLTPRVESELVIIWKKYQIFSSASEIFLSRLLKEFPSAPADE